MVHEPVHIVHLFTVHSVNFFEFQIIVIYLIVVKAKTKMNHNVHLIICFSTNMVH
jgi:hypothetical protein